MLKNMMLYRIANAETVNNLADFDLLTQALESKPSTYPKGGLWRTIGFGAPLPTLSQELVWSGTGGANVFCVYFHERQLPGSVIRNEVDARIKKIEEREMRKCYKKEIAQMKDEVVQTLLPKAFIRSTAVTIIAIGDLLIVGSSSAKKAEDCLSTLRDAIGTLAIRPLNLKLPGEAWLGDIMRNGSLGKFTCGETAKLVDEHKDVVTFKGVDLSTEEPQAYLNEQNFRIAQLGVVFAEDFGCQITSQMVFKAIKFSDVLFEGVTADANGDDSAYYDGSLAIFVNSILAMVEELGEVVGEEVPKQGIDTLKEKVDKYMDEYNAKVVNPLTDTMDFGGIPLHNPGTIDRPQDDEDDEI